METDASAGGSEKFQRSRRLASSRGLAQRVMKNFTDSKILSKSSERYKQELNSKTNVNSNEPGVTINWELNEKISLSSGSSTGIEIRPDIRSGIGFTDKHKKIPTSKMSQSKNTNEGKIYIKSNTKNTLDLLNVSGFHADKKTTPNVKVHLFKEDEIPINVIKSDSKYEIGIPGECTISRKKRQDRRKVEDSIKCLKGNNVDLTGTVRRRWIPANQKIDDSIAKRLELIHELNQKILVNYERFQAKSKRTNAKSIIRESENVENTVKKSDKKLSRVALSDLNDNREQIIYSEVIKKRKKKTSAKKIIEKVMVHQVQEDTMDNINKSNDNVKFESTCKIKDVSKTLRDFTSKSKHTLEINDNFSLAKKPQSSLEVKPQIAYKNSMKLDDKSVTCSPEFNHSDFNSKQNKFNIMEIKTEKSINKPSEKSHKNWPENTKFHPDINFCNKNWKNGLYSSLKKSDRKDSERYKIVNTGTNNETETMEATKSLEKEILDNLNETIGRFDNEKCDETLVDEGAISDVHDEEENKGENEVEEEQTEEEEEEDRDDDSFSTDSIQITSPTHKRNPIKDTSHQETFNSSWDSGVGIDIGSGSGWVRIHTGLESSLVYLTLDTTSNDICRDMLLGDELSLYIQGNIEICREILREKKNNLTFDHLRGYTQRDILLRFFGRVDSSYSAYYDILEEVFMSMAKIER
ncbi:hypothetical protein PV326_003543 [Microctonus aethiopoides]|nr:hypothetical protein PV326_003543 [Microctonus aethiopoides]